MERRRASVPRERYALAMKRRGTTVLAGLGIGIALAVAILLGVAVPGVGHAGMRKCEDHFLDADDEMRLRAAAIKVLPKSAHLDEVGACWNPRNAYAWISTKKGTSIEGVQQWYEFPCSRKAQPWQCDPPRLKQTFAMSVNVAGASHLVELSFGREFSLERARALASRAIEAYLDPTSQLPSCGVRSLEEGYRLRGQSSLSPLPSGDKAIHVSVSNAAKDSVALDDVNVRIDFRPNADAALTEAACWWQLIVVT
jgi:hypothetical protein